MEMVTVGSREVNRIEYQGQPVVTFKMIDELHDSLYGNAYNAYMQNRGQFIEDKDFYIVNNHVKKSLGLHHKTTFLIGESGYLKLVKTFTDDLAWQVQGQLIDCYFHHKAQSIVPQPASSLALAELMLNTLKEQSAQITAVQAQVTHIQQTRRAETHEIYEIKEVVDAKVTELVTKHGLATPRVYSKMWRLLKAQFKVATYHALLSSQIPDALAFVKTIKLGHLAAI